MALHPSVAAVRGAVRRAIADLEPGARVVVACSGGADSMALLAATVFEGRQDALHVVGVTVDHGLQEGSERHAELVVAWMRRLGVAESLSARVSVDAPGMGPEAAAREARYAVLGQVAERWSAPAVLLGHTMDDQAETVLLGLARGSGSRALQGMRRRFEVYRRPLLDVTRSDTETACLTEGIEFWSDPHNAEERFARVRVRTRVLPLLEAELGPGVTAALARTAEQLRADTEYLDAVADHALADVAVPEGVPAGLAGGLEVGRLERLPDAVRTRVLRLAAVRAGSPPAELFHTHVSELDRLVTDWHGQKWIDLPGHLRGVRRDGVLRFESVGP